MVASRIVDSTPGRRYCTENRTRNTVKKIQIGILGATGTVGRRFMRLLESHPLFSVCEPVASERSAGKKYIEALAWKQETPVAGDAETSCATAGHPGVASMDIHPMTISAQCNRPAATKKPGVVIEQPDRPQPARDGWVRNGMSAVVGRIRPCSVLDFKMILPGNNTVRGAAGAAILSAGTYQALGHLW